MLLWELLIRAQGDYERAKGKGRVLEWLAARLPNCFVRTTDGKFDHIEEPPGWNNGQTFDANYDTLMRLARANAGPRSKAKRKPLAIGPSDERTAGRALMNLRPVVMIDRVNGAELTFGFSAEYHLHGTFNNLEEFWQVAFMSFFHPDWLPWRGSYCAGCGRPMPPTKKCKKPSGTKLCSGCRVRKCRAEASKSRRTKPTKM